MWSPDLNPERPPPLFIVQNQGSGHYDTAALREATSAVLKAAGREHHYVLAARGAEVPTRAAEAVARAQAVGGVVVAAGGDGTQNAVANAALGRCAMGVLPQGTFNYFARTHGVPAEPEAAARLLVTGQPQPVQVGLVGEHAFLVNASLGLYPQLLEDREAWKARLGRSQLVALGAGAASLLSLGRPMRLHLASPRGTADLPALTLFVGNNPLQCAQLGLPEPERVGEGWLAGLLLKPVGTWRMLGLMARGALGMLGEADDLMRATFQTVHVQPRRKRRTVKVAMDGEVLRLPTPLEFRVSPQPLWVLKARA